MVRPPHPQIKSTYAGEQGDGVESTLLQQSCKSRCAERKKTQNPKIKGESWSSMPASGIKRSTDCAATWCLESVQFRGNPAATSNETRKCWHERATWRDNHFASSLRTTRPPTVTNTCHVVGQAVAWDWHTALRKQFGSLSPRQTTRIVVKCKPSFESPNNNNDNQHLAWLGSWPLFLVHWFHSWSQWLRLRSTLTSKGSRSCLIGV